jgi:phosphotransferase system enzyme I (PtsI)
MSFTLHGIGASSGIAIGRAHLASPSRVEVAHYSLPESQVDPELKRFDDAVEQTRTELRKLRSQIPASAPAELPAFLDMHLLILDDNMIDEEPKRLIREQRCNAEWALTQQMEALVARFEEIEDPYLRSRQEDVVQVVQRVIKVLVGHPGQLPAGTEGEECVLVSHELTPADMIQFKSTRFAAFITDLGGATSHTAIMARSLGIPSVMALHQARSLIKDHEWIIVDGREGVVIVDPDEKILEEYRHRQAAWIKATEKLKKLKTSRAKTLDGTNVELFANIELPQDMPAVLESGAQGIGLFRSEFLFLNRDDLPTEEEQFEAYKTVAETMEDKPVTIRTLDLGADKQAPWGHTVADNPALGLRAIRLCLAEPRLFETQLRAILRASVFGKVRILIPMLGNFGELKATLQLIAATKESLREEGIRFDERISVGGMIEVPAAALLAEQFAKQLDFLSIGTNDLIQYTLAIDRADDAVAHLYDPLHPAVLNLIQHTIRSGQKAGKPVSVCGEMAGDSQLTRLLLGLGLRHFSMQPASILAVKHQILGSMIDEVTDLAIPLLKNTDAEKTASLLGKLNGKS